ncbi:MAG TPA: hypothetical protein VMD59_19185 [Acidimicrobiales bacterium]|nr:hypothetical protein [Acidimicrobiales bacterium]
MAVREAARFEVIRRLRELGQQDLADGFEGDGESRRAAIDRLQGALQGLQSIDADTPEVLEAAAASAQLWQREVVADRDELLPAAARVLGPPGRRGLPSARSVRARSTLHPHPKASWYDGITALTYLRAALDHFQNSTYDVFSPALGDLEEHTPGPS